MLKDTFRLNQPELFLFLLTSVILLAGRLRSGVSKVSGVVRWATLVRGGVAGVIIFGVGPLVIARVDCFVVFGLLSSGMLLDERSRTEKLILTRVVPIFLAK